MPEFSYLRRAACAALTLMLAACGTTHEFARGPNQPDFASPKVLEQSPPLQCVPYARGESGVLIYGDADTWWMQSSGRYPRSNIPTEGAVLVINSGSGSSRGHLAVVRRVISAREIVVDHANWLNRGEIDLDSPIIDVSAHNDWSQVRVWYTPDGQYGARAYAALGFIYPFRDLAAN